MSALDHIRVRYQQLRQVSRRLNNILMDRIPNGGHEEGGRKLGILHNGILVFDNECEMDVLADYCIHDLRREGRNVVDDYVAENPPAEGSDEALVLRAMQAARFVVGLIQELEPGTGVHLLDVMRQEKGFLADVKLSEQGKPGWLMAARVMDVGEFWMTTGAPLPVCTEGTENFVKALETIDVESFSTEEKAGLHAGLIQGFLGRRFAPHIPRGSAPRSRQEPVLVGARVGRNDACPCGSGRKFKHCCMRQSSVRTHGSAAG